MTQPHHAIQPGMEATEIRSQQPWESGTPGSAATSPGLWNDAELRGIVVHIKRVLRLAGS